MVKYIVYIYCFIFIYTLEATSLKSQLSLKQATTADTKVFTIDETKNNTVISVLKNTIINLNVNGNPTTGYSVYLKNYDSIDKTALNFTNLKYDSTAKLYTSNDYVPYTFDPKMVGSGGYYKFEINVSKDFNSAYLQFIQLKSFDLTSETAKINLNLTTSDLTLYSITKVNNSNFYNINLVAVILFSLTILF